MASQSFTLYSPAISRETNEFVPAAELRAKLVEFYTLYKPQNAKGRPIDGYLDFAREKGVLALRTVLKHKYKANLDDADASEVGWARIYRKLQAYYKFHAPGKTVDIIRIFRFAKERGLLALDSELEKKYNETLSEFMTKGLTQWKKNWKSVLQHHHAESMTYELRRFYNFVDTLPQKYPQNQKLEYLVDWAVKHTRTEVNEKLLEKYKFCLDDVKIIKGATLEERKINLKFQLIEFYQKHDPNRLGDVTLIQSETEVESAEMKALERDAAQGIYKLEQLDEKLKRTYGQGLEDNFTKELRRRLIAFYDEVNETKSKQAINKVVDFAKKRGLDALNEKLNLTYGSGIRIDDL